MKLGHRPGLDGLRGVAVALVVVSHAAGQRGAQVGVTMFFVLSGFLITTLLVEERDEAGRIDLGGFYLRRARRLLPALLVVVSALAVVGVLGGEHLGPVLLYYANWSYIGDPELLGASLGHFWSLAVEEQFYLVWPLVLIVAGKRAAVVVAAVGVVLSVLVRFTTEDPLHMIYGSDTRADALLIGCLCGMLLHRLEVPSVRAGRLAWGVLGVVAVGLADDGRWFGTVGLTVVALAGAVVLLRSLAAPGLLAAASLRHLGRVSYGLYLIHVPVLVAMRGFGWAGTGASVVVSWGLAVLSYRLIETPLRSHAKHLRPPAEPVSSRREQREVRRGARLVAQT